VVAIAATGEKAIELTGHHRPDLVLMDIQLQGAMDGITAADEIRKRFYRPVVFLTAYSEEATLQRAKLVEPFGYILKPFEDRELKIVIEIALYKHQADDQIRRLNRLYMVLSRVNQATVKVKSGPELWDAVCRIVVEQGGFQLAWFGNYDAHTHRVVPVAQCGELKNFIQPVSTKLVAPNQYPGPAGGAVYEKCHFICNDISSHPRATLWAPAAQTVGLRSAAGFCLWRSNGDIAGVLTLYSTQRDFFQLHEIALLEEVLADVQFALDYLQKEKLRCLAELDTKHRLKFESHIASVSVRFVGNQDFDDMLNASLEEMGVFLGIDRAFVLQLRPDGKALDNTHEWCLEAGNRRQVKLQKLPTSELIVSLGVLKNGGIVNIRDTAKLPPATAADSVGLQKLAGKAVLLLPLLNSDRLIGFLGFGNERMAKDWSTDDTKLLRVSADLISRAITQRLAEHTMRTINERFQAFMGHTPAIAWAKDEHGQYIYLNQTFEKQLGVNLADWFGKTAIDVWPAALAQEVTATDQKVLATGAPVEFITKTKTDTGPKQSWQCIKFIFADEHGRRYLGGIGFNITEKQALVTQLRQAQKMELVGTLAAGVAHDFNNLLCVVLGFGELALQKLNPTDVLYKHVTEIRAAGHRATVLARQLLTLSHKQVFEPQVLDVNKLVIEAQKMLARLIRADIEMTLRLGPVLPVKTDPGQLEQVIINLVVNARDAMPTGGKLWIETGNVTLAQPIAATGAQISPGNYVVLTVRDTGHGMTDEVRERIFEPFFTTKPDSQGTGLGLAVSFGIIQQSGGNIVVKSAEGKGTTFQIYLPQQPVTATAAETTPAEAHSMGGTETILLVDDNPDILEISSLILRESGYHVFTATSGERARSVLQQRAATIKLVIT
ncbi:MAG: ATP-binding protein, partial [Verrucomicrobiota bacterium]